VGARSHVACVFRRIGVALGEEGALVPVCGLWDGGGGGHLSVLEVFVAE
jgi:hypothetical protein